MSIKTNEYKTLITQAKAGALINKDFTIPQRQGEPGGTPTDAVSEDTMISQIQKLDSIHDFGGSRGSNIACDTITLNRVNKNFIYNAMRMTYIQQCSFDSQPPVPAIMANIPIINFSSLSYPAAAAEPRAVDDIENYCVLLSMKKKMQSNGGAGAYSTFFKQLDIQPNATLLPLKNEIRTFFNSYTDSSLGTGKINFIVDTPGDLSKILKSNITGENDAFAYILTQESAHDSASSKSSPLSPDSINQCYNKNGYVEVLNFGLNDTFRKFSGAPLSDNDKNQVLASITREYSNNYDDTQQNKGKFESHFTIKFGGMKYEIVDKKEYYYTDVTYSGKPATQCKLNQKPHPTNVNTIVTEIKKVNTTNKELDNTDKAKLISGEKNKFYNDFNNKPIYKLSPDDSNKLDYSFTKKRAGDGLQAKVVKMVNSNKLVLYCNKQYVDGVNPPSSVINYVKGGTNIETIYKIRRLVLVTIDRVLFSYCVKNDIPVILSGDKYLLLFKPAIALPPMAGGSNQKLSIKNNINLKMNNDNLKKKSNDVISKKIVQTGGESLDEIVELFKNIPYCFLKALPHLLNENRSIFRLETNKIQDLTTLIQTNEENKKLFSVFLNGKSCIYLTPNDPSDNGKVIIGGAEYGYCQFDGNKEFIIYTDRVKVQKNNADSFNYTFDNTQTTITSQNIQGFVSGKISADNKYNIRSRIAEINKADFDIFMQSIDPEYVPPGYAPAMYEGGAIFKNKDQMSISNSQEYDEPEVSTESRSSSSQMNSSNDRMSTEGELLNQQMSTEGELLNDRFFEADKMQGLNMYLQFFYNNNISSVKNSLTLDENLLVTNNYIAIMSYLSLFNSFEMNMCWDNDGYDENFSKIKNLEVTNKIRLYLLFYNLLLDFEEQKDKICYGLLEYFVHPKNSGDNYFIIEDDLSSLIHYVTCSYVNLPLSVNQRIENLIDAEIIKTDNQVYNKTKQYFVELGDKINNQSIMISEYLYNDSENEMTEFVKKYLNMYGFMMMSDIFYVDNDETHEDSENLEKEKENDYLQKEKEYVNRIGGLKITKITKKRNIKNKHKRGNKTKKLRKTKKTKKQRKLRRKKTKKEENK